ncbi:epididymal-specific lipocalin-9 [Ictidomys tridecemlineatus]|uniref:epididymal-specific lipocalin-9 n=1 Tax=Ictidomys tridecemlineatus TaxID=43179 RepID=UPI00038C38C9|nr:epididymal-specific lipocalin-9 [Ictidomys tridecemlineatus]KAG3288323.1 lipocalin 9 [Ictidomys tridecemlineatus]
MALLLLVLGLSAAGAQKFNPLAVVDKNYNMARISGVWYSISMASNNLSRIKEDGDLRIFIRNIEHLKNGSLKFDFRFMVQGECVGVSMVCQKTNKNGEYSISYEGENKVLVSETDYRMYVIFDMQNVRNGTETRVLALYGRIPKLSQNFQHRFHRVCRKYRLSSKNILDLTQEDHCYSKR